MSPIAAVHTLIYSDDPGATRRFLREVLGFPFVSDQPPTAEATDSDWLIFGTGPSELGVHPTSSVHEGTVYESPLHHRIAFVCTDLEASMSEIRGRGGVFTREPRDDGYGITVELEVPGAELIMLYQPRHTVAYEL